MNEEIKYGLKSAKTYFNFAKRVRSSKKNLINLFKKLKKIILK